MLFRSRGRAATLGLEPSAIEPLIVDLLAALAARIGEPPASLLDHWRALDALRGREVRWAQGSGLAGGVDDCGRLLVRTPEDRTVALDAGEVHLTGGG